MCEEEPNPPRPFWYQKVFVAASAVSLGFLALGSSFSAIRDALPLVNPWTTYIGTGLIVVTGACVQFYLTRHPLAWVTRGHESRITRLGIRPIFVFVGALVLLWIPRFISDSKTNTFRQLALGSTRKNLASIHFRIRELREPVELIRTRDAAQAFKSLPDRLGRTGNLDLSFCRTMEFHVTDLEPTFLRAATAYCGTVSDFSETESQLWNLFQQSPNVQKLISADEPEAQLALACTLIEPETFYIVKFQMILHSAEKMGLEEHDLLVGSKKMDLPDIQPPTPFIEEYLRTQFHVDCGTGKILR